VQVDADVASIGDLKPEPLTWIGFPPLVYPPRLMCPIFTHGCASQICRGGSATITAPGSIINTVPTNEFLWPTNEGHIDLLYPHEPLTPRRAMSMSVMPAIIDQERR
jgi:hypothetical protein